MVKCILVYNFLKITAQNVFRFPKWNPQTGVGVTAGQQAHSFS